MRTSSQVRRLFWPDSSRPTFTRVIDSLLAASPGRALASHEMYDTLSTEHSVARASRRTTRSKLNQFALQPCEPILSMLTTSTAPAQRCATRLRSRTARHQRESAPTAAGTRPQSAQSPRMEPLSGRALPDTQPDALSCRRVGRRSTPAVSAYVQSVLRARSPPRASLAESATDLARWLVWSGSERGALEDPARSARATLLSGGSPMQQEPAKSQPAEGEKGFSNVAHLVDNRTADGSRSKVKVNAGLNVVHGPSRCQPVPGRPREPRACMRAARPSPVARRARTPIRQSANPRLTARRCRGVQGIYHARRHVPPADVDFDVCDARRATK